MPEINATEIRSGILIEHNKRLWRVIKSNHVHVGGRGGAYMQVEMKDIESGTKTSQRFRTDDRVDRPVVESKQLRYLYQDGESFVFMDEETFEQTMIPAELLEGREGYLLPDTAAQINFHEGRPLGVALPSSVALEITDTEPQLKGSTATSSYKPATVETGITVMVPPFISTGEKVRVNTETGEYVERA